jgi:hypothetical protein
MTERFRPSWMWIAVLIAVVVGIVAAAWLFGALSGPG